MIRRKDILNERVPEYIIINENEQAFIGLIGGYPEFSYDLKRAKTYNEISKFNGFKKLFQHFEVTKMDI